MARRRKRRPRWPSACGRVSLRGSAGSASGHGGRRLWRFSGAAPGAASRSPWPALERGSRVNRRTHQIAKTDRNDQHCKGPGGIHLTHYRLNMGGASATAQNNHSEAQKKAPDSCSNSTERRFSARAAIGRGHTSYLVQVRVCVRGRAGSLRGWAGHMATSSSWYLERRLGLGLIAGYLQFGPYRCLQVI